MICSLGYIWAVASLLANLSVFGADAEIDATTAAPLVLMLLALYFASMQCWMALTFWVCYVLKRLRPRP